MLGSTKSTKYWIKRMGGCKPNPNSSTSAKPIIFLLKSTQTEIKWRKISITFIVFWTHIEALVEN